MREELKQSPLMFGIFEMKEKQHDIYLGNALSERGLAASVKETISNWRVVNCKW